MASLFQHRHRLLFWVLLAVALAIFVATLGPKREWLQQTEAAVSPLKPEILGNLNNAISLLALLFLVLTMASRSRPWDPDPAKQTRLRRWAPYLNLAALFLIIANEAVQVGVLKANARFAGEERRVVECKVLLKGERTLTYYQCSPEELPVLKAPAATLALLNKLDPVRVHLRQGLWFEFVEQQEPVSEKLQKKATTR